MKLFVYNYRAFDEAEWFQKYGAQYGVELGFCPDAPTMENAQLARGYDALSILTSKTDAQLLRKFAELGIRMISTRTIGYDHIDIEAAARLGIGVSNIGYDIGCVADYTVMLILMAIRKVRRIIERANINDFTLRGIQGRQLHNLTVGIVGTGRIGCTVLRSLSGFGCRLLAHDLRENAQAAALAQYLPLDQLLEQADIVSLHMPLTDQNFHMIGRSAFERMKPGAVLINTARGGLVDSEALISALESGKLGGAALDVVENEFGLYYNDRKSDVLDNRELSILRGFPNVIVTPHMAFYTDKTIDDMVHYSIKSCLDRLEGREDRWKVV